MPAYPWLLLDKEQLGYSILGKIQLYMRKVAEVRGVNRGSGAGQVFAFMPGR